MDAVSPPWRAGWATPATCATSELATVLFLALEMGRPLLLEGEPGTGKTALAEAVAEALGPAAHPAAVLRGHRRHAGALRLGLPAPDPAPARARGAVRRRRRPPDLEEAEKRLYDERFLLARPVLAALQQSPAVLLVDEVDRADDEFEAFLLEVLSTYQVTIPELGTVQAATPPTVVLTSNRTRELHDALKRRCLYHWIDHPGLEREVAIVRSRAPEVSAALARQVVEVVQQLRDARRPAQAARVWPRPSTGRARCNARDDRSRPRDRGPHPGRAGEVPRGRRPGAGGSRPDARRRRRSSATPCTSIDARPVGGDEVLLGFTRALRAAGVPVTRTAPAPTSTAVAVVGVGDRTGDLLGGSRDAVRAPRTTSRATTGCSRRGSPPTCPARPPTGRSADGAGRGRRSRPTHDADGAGDGDGHGDVPGRRQRRRRCCGTATWRRSRRRERQRLAALFATLPVRHPAAPGGPARTPGTAATSTPPARSATSLRRMGEPARDPHGGGAVPRPRRVVLLVDVSGSMSGYADALLRARAPVRRRRRPGAVEVFTVGTRLTHLTRPLRLRDPDRALVAAGETVPDWSGGTRLGETLQAFLDRWGQRGMARGAVVVIFSDGWERGDPALLGEQVAAAAPARPPRRLGQPAPRQDRLRARAAGHRRGAAARRRLRRRALAGDVRRARWRSSPMREVLPELMPGGRPARPSAWAPSWRPSAPHPARPARRCWSARTASAVGSVSGGCVEGAVYDLAQEVVGDGTPVLQRYGVSDDDAFAVGLTCGGILDVFVEKVSQETFPSSVRSPPTSRPASPVAVATVVEHPDPSLARPPDGDRPRAAARPASLGSARGSTTPSATTRSGCSRAGTAATLGYGPDGERRGEGMRVFVWAFAPPPRMLVFGAIDFAAAVARMGELPRLPRHGLRRPPRVRDDEPVPRRRRGGRRLAAPLPRGGAGGGPDRPSAP